MANAIEGQSETFDEQRPERAERPERAARPSGGPFHVLKPGQGTRLRWGTALGAGALALAGGLFIREQIQLINFGEQYDFIIRTSIWVGLMLAAFYGIFALVGRNEKIIEFMTATEGEMKKVNWSTRREVWGATKVVIVTVLALGFILAIVDLAFILIFSAVGVLRMNLIEKLFSSGGS